MAIKMQKVALLDLFLIYPLVLKWMAPFLKENQQLPDADARCTCTVGSQMTEQTLENTLHRPYQRRAQDERKHNRKKLLLRTGGGKNAWVIKECIVSRLTMKNVKSPSFFSRDQLKVSVRTRNAAKSFSERPFDSPSPSNPRYDHETLFRTISISSFSQNTIQNMLVLIVLIHLYRPGENLWCHDVTHVDL